MFTDIDNRVMCILFCICRVTLLLHKNSIDRYLLSYAGDTRKNITSCTLRSCCKQTGTCPQIGLPTFIKIRSGFSTSYVQINGHTENRHFFFLQLFVIKYAPKPKWYEAVHSMKNVFSFYLLQSIKTPFQPFQIQQLHKHLK